VKAARYLANLAIGAVLMVVGLCFVVSLCVLFFKLNGQLAEGEPMYMDLATPTWGGLLLFQAGCAVVLAACILLRRALARRP
jgi:UDP-N-acetylmuramyl pentapeptide phosphotransferase/UDP-N-acetylglucosamine-1-phosphate transferase